MNKELKIIGLVLLLFVILSTAFGERSLLDYLSGYLNTESDIKLKLVNPSIGSAHANESVDVGLVISPHISAIRINESDYSIEGNIYSGGIGGRLNESGLAVYLVPENAFRSYKEDVTAYDEVSTTTFNAMLSQGWNLISLPLNI